MDLLPPPLQTTRFPSTSIARWRSPNPRIGRVSVLPQEQFNKAFQNTRLLGIGFIKVLALPEKGGIIS